MRLREEYFSVIANYLQPALTLASAVILATGDAFGNRTAPCNNSKASGNLTPYFSYLIFSMTWLVDFITTSVFK